MNKNLPRMKPADQNFLSQLFEQCYPQIYKYIYSSIRNEDITSDIAAEVFVLACEKIEELKVHPNPIGWLYLTARNKTREFSRKTKVEIISLDENSDFIMNHCDYVYSHSDYFMKELELTLHESLTSDEYNRFLRYFIWGYSISEISEMERISNNNVSVHLSRLRQKVKKYLQG